VTAAPLLAVDTASPLVSVAVTRGDRVLAAREGAQRESSARLIGWIDEVLAEAGVTLGELAGAVAIRGPGSFTGLRVGLATLLGFHQATGLPVTALPTLEVLAAAAGEGARARRVLSLVPAGPGDWFAQTFAGTWPPRALGEPQRVGSARLAAIAAGDVGDGVEEPAAVDLVAVAAEEHRARLSNVEWLPDRKCTVEVTGTLAAVAGRLVGRHPRGWDATLLSAPLYLAPAPVTLPGAPKPVLPRTFEPAR